MKHLFYTIFGICWFLFGVFCGFLYFDMYFLRLVLLFFLIFICFFFFVSLYINFKYFIVLTVFFVFGVVLILNSFSVSKHDVSKKLGNNVLCGVIDRDVLMSKRGWKTSMNVYRILNDETYIDGRVLILSNNIKIEYGDKKCFFGKLSLPEPFDGFRYDRFLLRYRITAVFEVIAFESKFDFDLSISYKLRLFLFKNIFKLKHFMEMRLGRLFVSPYSGFVAGLLFGSRGGLPSDLLDNFSTVGLTHIIAISGYNITILILLIGKIFSFVNFKIKIFLSSFLILLFVIFVGADASVVRAGIMGGISLMAILFHRSYLPLLALFLSAFLMVVFNPLILIYDIGFQLSVLATLGLITYGTVFMEKFKFFPEFFYIRESMSMTLSAQIFVIPIIIMNFDKLSLISPFANIFVLPFLPYIMLFGFIALVFSFFSMSIGFVFAFIAYLLMVCVIFFVDLFSSFSYASINMPNLSFWIFFFYYYVFLIIFLRKFKNLRK